MLAVLRQPPTVVREQVRPERLEEKLGWLRAFEADVAEWSEWQRVAEVSVAFVNRQGIYRGAAKQLRTELRPHRVHPSSRSLANDLVAFVARQARRARPEERFPGSTEVLESCFGRFKQLEKQQARGGFTSLILGFGALLAETATEVVQQAMEHSRTKAIWEWSKHHLGTTLFARRQLAFAASATKDG